MTHLYDPALIESLNDISHGIQKLVSVLSSGVAQGAVADNTPSSSGKSPEGSSAHDAAGQPEPVTPAQETVTKAQLIEFLSSLKTDPTKKQGLVAIFKTFGTSKLSEIDPSHYGSIMEQARSL